MRYGLDDTILKKIEKVFADYPQIKQVLIFGSRVKGNYKPGSDIDITLVGDGIHLDLLNKITGNLDDLLLPYLFDVSIFNHIKNTDLNDHINQVGKLIYKKEENVLQL